MSVGLARCEKGIDLYHRTELIGNLGADPELRFTVNGNAVVSFNVAVNESWNNAAGEKQQRTEWYSCIAWNRQAEVIAQYLSKGDQTFIAGRMQTRTWDGPDGTKHYRTELIVSECKFLNTKTKERGGAEQYDRPRESVARAEGSPLLQAALEYGATRGPDAGGDIEPDDLPFAWREPSSFDRIV